MARPPHYDRLWREALQHPDLIRQHALTLQQTVDALRVEYANDLAALPDNEWSFLEDVEDMACQTLFLLEQVARLEAQLDQRGATQRGPLQDSRRRVAPPAMEQESVSQVPEDWE